MTEPRPLLQSGALALAVVAALGVGVAHAQPTTGVSPGTVDVEVDPIKCWWRTSAGAIRVGEPFAVVLTCAVVENELNVVVPDQSRLEPTALQLPPFEVLGGTHFADSHSPDRRFFQYEYRTRLIQDDAFGKDAPLPELVIKYRIGTRTPDSSYVEGRELDYILPSFSIRVLSLVPDDASDIRDATEETFSDLDTQAFRANFLRILAGLLFSLGVVMAVLALIRLSTHVSRHDESTSRLAPDTVVLRRAARELASVRRMRERDGWSEGLAGRALSALRIVGAYALARRTSQSVAPEKSNGLEGQLGLRGGWLGDTRVFVSGSVTAAGVGQALAQTEPGSPSRSDLERLQAALGRFMATQYSRDGRRVDEDALDESLEHGRALARRLSVQHLWPIKKLNMLTGKATELGRRVWLRWQP